MEVAFDIGREITGAPVHAAGKPVSETVIHAAMADIWMLAGAEVVDGVSDGKFLHILCNGISMLMAHTSSISDA